MSFDRKYITKLKLLSEEVLNNDMTLSPTVRLLVETLSQTTVILFDELEVTKIRLNGAEEEISKIKLKLAKNSSNSSLPSSTNRPGNAGKKKPRIPSAKKPGAQIGHTGQTLLKIENPDKIIVHKLKGRCGGCGYSLKDLIVTSHSERQVFDIAIERVVTSHQAEFAECTCGKKHTAFFPEGVTNHTQYGEIARSFINYFSLYQLIPYERLSEIFKDLFNMPLSEGTICNTNNKCNNGLTNFEENLKRLIVLSKVNHVDESPIKVKDKNCYLHVFSNDKLTYLYASESRGQKALDDMGLLGDYTNFLVHDSYAMYFSNKYKNCLCHSHLSREFLFIEEELKKRWGHKLRRFFLDLNDFADDYRGEKKSKIPASIRQAFEDEFDKIIEEAKLESPDWILAGKKKSQDANLLRRIIIRKEAVLRFMHNLDVPFTNNQAERDLRMAKVRQKISGCFISLETANVYARIRGFISTLKKQGLNILEGIGRVHSNPNHGFLELF